MPNPNPPGNLNITPGAIDFGNVIVGAPATVTVTLNNDGEGPLIVTSVSISPGTDYALGSYSIGLPAHLNPGVSMTFVLTFTPSAAVVRAATLSAAWSDSWGVEPPTTASVTGTGVLANSAVFIPTTLGYANTQLGQTLQHTAVVKNEGAVDLNITALNFTTGTSFSLIGAPGLPVTLHPGDTQSLTIQFLPVTTGTITDTLTATVSVGANPTLALSGVGLAIVPIAICVNNDEQVVLGGYDASGLAGQPAALQLLSTDLNAPQAGQIVFNGAIWQGLGAEKTLFRLGFYYENYGVATLTGTVKCFRPTVGTDSQDSVAFSIVLGTAIADLSERYAEVDVVASGEILTLTLNRAVSAGPVSIMAIVPYFQPRGEKVRNV